MAETKISQPQRTLVQRYMECKEIIEATFITDRCKKSRIVILRTDFLKEMLGRSYNSKWLGFFTQLVRIKDDEEFAFNTVQWLCSSDQNPDWLLGYLMANIKKEDTLVSWLDSLRTQ